MIQLTMKNSTQSIFVEGKIKKAHFGCRRLRHKKMTTEMNFEKSFLLMQEAFFYLDDKNRVNFAVNIK